MITINTRGARTLADARPLMYGGQNVYVTFNGKEAALHLGGGIVAHRPAAEVATIEAAQDWAYEVIEAANETVTAEREAEILAMAARTNARIEARDAQSVTIQLGGGRKLVTTKGKVREFYCDIVNAQTHRRAGRQRLALATRPQIIANLGIEDRDVKAVCDWAYANRTALGL